MYNNFIYYALLVSTALVSLLSYTSTAAPLPDEHAKRIMNGFYLPEPLSKSSVFLMQDLGEQFATCGGTILSPTHIATAAHCVNTPDGIPAEIANITIGYGSPNVLEQTRVPVLKITIHPDYVQTDLDGLADLAIIEVDPITLNDSVQKMSIYDGPIDVHQNLLAIGWGQTENGSADLGVLKGVVVMTGDKDMCGVYSKTFTDNNGPQVCTPAALTPNRSTCQGDSGTGLVVNIDGQIMLAAIDSVSVSMTKEAACGSATNVHLNLHAAYYLDFIASTTGLSKAYLTGVSDS